MWRREYSAGAGFEVYRVALTPGFEGRLYAEVKGPFHWARRCCSAIHPLGPLARRQGRTRSLSHVPLPCRQVVHKAYEQLGVVVIAVEMYSKGGCESP